jgi:general secretion pathway protein F
MPIFKYKGYRAGGAETSGTIEAEGLRDAAVKIKELGLYPRDITPAEKAGRRGRGFRRSERAMLPQLTRQLSVLMASGVPLVEAIQAVSREARGRWKNVLVDVRERVAGGASLARAMEGHQSVFPESYINLVAAGEQSGNLDDVFMKLADFLEGQQSMKDKVSVALIYPIFMMGVVLVVLVLLFTYVVPKIVTVFEQREVALPLATVILIALSHFFSNYWWALLGGAAVLGYSGKRILNRYRERVDRLLLRALPSLYLSRFARTLGFLLEGGVPMLRALELSGRASANQVLEGIVKTAEGRVSEGARLSASLEGLPPVMLELVATGEKSGQLPMVLGRAATSYESEFDRRIQRFLAILEPSMIIFMGLIVAFIVFAILLPMFQMNQLIQ